MAGEPLGAAAVFSLAPGPEAKRGAAIGKMRFWDYFGRTGTLALIIVGGLAVLCPVAVFVKTLILAPLVAGLGFAHFAGSESDSSAEIQALVKLMAERHPSTLDHGRRMMNLCRELGGRFGLSKRHCDMLAVAALLHDIGKTAISFAILDKPGSLTPKEFSEIKRHSEIGARMLARTTHLRRLSAWVHFHHERMDGNGYPTGLAGRHIPLESRIIAVVDAYDAMVGGGDGARSYQALKTTSQAFEELRRCSNSQFDSAVVEEFIALVAPNGAVLSSIGD